MAEERSGEPAALLTYQAVAERLGVPKGTIQFWVSRHEIPHVRLGPRSVRFRPGEIERWLDERAVGATGEASLHQGDDDLGLSNAGGGGTVAVRTRRK